MSLSWSLQVVRLDFVHSTATVERWVEEVGIIGREMAATCRSFQQTAMRWAVRASEALTVPVEDDLEWASQPQEVRGYVAYASRQFHLYTDLADSAYIAFHTATGERVWNEIWNAP